MPLSGTRAVSVCIHCIVKDLAIVDHAEQDHSKPIEIVLAAVAGLMSDALFLRDDVRRVDVNPVVLFSVLDHYMRRVEGQKRVIGTLIGQVKEGVCHVQGCFPVPHLEKDGEVAVGKDFNRSMLELQKRCTAGEGKVVGWYSTSLSDTGALINEQSCLIQEFYESEYGHEHDDSKARTPVLLVLDTSLKGESLDAKAFLSSPTTLRSTVHENTFQQLPLTILNMAARGVTDQGMLLDNLVRAQAAGAGEPGADALAALEGKVDGLERSMRRLLAMLERTTEYVGDVVAGKQEANSEMARMVADALAAVPRAAPEQFDTLFNNSLQDLLMVLYLSNLTRTQLAITDHLSLRISEQVAANKPQ